MKRTAESIERGVDDPRTERTPKSAREDDRFSILTPPVRDKFSSLFETGLVARYEIDEKALEQLRELGEVDGVQVLEQFRTAGLENVRNKSAYLSSVMKRFRLTRVERDSRGSNGGGLSPDAQSLLDQLEISGHLTGRKLDERCMNALSALSDLTQIQVLKDFQTRDLSDVRNLSAFFMSIIKKYERSGDSGRSASRFSQNSFSPVRSFYPNGAGNRELPYNPLDAAALHALPSYTYSPSYPPPPTAVPFVPSGRQHHGLEQVKWGVRVDEFHALSVFAPFVHPAAALKLQQLWDSGIKLLSQMDDKCWEAITELSAQNSVAVIEEVADKLKYGSGDVLSIPLFFLGTAGKYTKLAPLQPAAARPTLYPGLPAALPPVMPPIMPHMLQTQALPLAAGSNPSSVNNPLLYQLSSHIQIKIDALIAGSGGLISASHFDTGLVEALKSLTEEQQANVIDEVRRNDPATVRNPAAYIMGICRRYQRGGERR